LKRQARELITVTAGRGTRADIQCPPFINNPNGPANFIRQLYLLWNWRLPRYCELVGSFCSFNGLAVENKKGKVPASRRYGFATKRNGVSMPAATSAHCPRSAIGGAGSRKIRPMLAMTRRRLAKITLAWQFLG